MKTMNPNYEIDYGTKYDKSLDIAEVAKKVRAEIKAAIKAGTLPSLKASVRVSRFSGGESMRVEINKAHFQVQSDEFLAYVAGESDCRPDERYTEVAQQALNDIKAMVNAYNFDGSDTMTDYFHVNFYPHVDYSWDVEKAEQKAAEAKAAEALQAQAKADYSRPQAVWNF